MRGIDGAGTSVIGLPETVVDYRESHWALGCQDTALGIYELGVDAGL